MSVVKHLNGHIPIINSNYNHLDSFFQAPLIKLPQNLQSFPEDFLEQIKNRREKTKSLHERSIHPLKKLKEISRFNDSFSNVKTLLRNDCLENSIENDNISILLKNSYSNILSSSINKNQNEDAKILPELKKLKVKRIKKIDNVENSLQRNEEVSVMNAKQFKGRLQFLMNNEINLRKNNFWNKIIINSGKKQHENKKLIPIIKNEKETKSLNPIQKSEKKISPLNSKQSINRNIAILKPIIQENNNDNHQYHLKFKKKAKSLALKAVEFGKFHTLANKLMKNINKLNHLNNLNGMKSYYDLFELIQENNKKGTNMKDLFLDHPLRRINPKLDVNFLLKSFFIDTFKYNDPKNDQESLKINKEFIQICEKLKTNLKELILQKRLKNFKKKKEEIIQNNKDLFNLQNKVLAIIDIKKRSELRKNFKNFEKYQAVIGKDNNPFDIMKVIRKFEVIHGPLTLNKKTRIMGEELTEMISGVKSNVIQINLNDTNVFYSIN